MNNLQIIFRTFKPTSQFYLNAKSESCLYRTVSSAMFSSSPPPTTLQEPLVNNSPNSEHEEMDKLYRLLEVEVRGNDPAVLKSYSWFATTAARELGVKVGDCWAPRKANHHRLTLLKSIHIYKKHRVQYEIRTYFRFMQFLQLTGSTADTFLEYIQRNLPEGVAMKTTRVALEHLPSHLASPSQPQSP